MQTDVKAANAAATGVLTAFRTRLKGMALTVGGTAGDVVFRDGAGGTVLITIAVPASTEVHGVDIPGEGVLFPLGVHVTLPTAAAVTIFYG